MNLENFCLNTKANKFGKIQTDAIRYVLWFLILKQEPHDGLINITVEIYMTQGDIYC